MTSQASTPKQQSLREQVRAEFPYLIAADTLTKPANMPVLGAKNVKRLLTHEWPDIPFHVTSERSPDGSSIDVSWPAYTDAPRAQVVQDKIQNNFSAARRDGPGDNTYLDDDPRYS